MYLIFQLLGIGQLVSQLRWKLACQTVLGDTDRFVEPSQGILDFEVVALRAKDDPDRGILSLFTDIVVQQVQVEVDLAGVFWFEPAGFELSNATSARRRLLLKRRSMKYSLSLATMLYWLPMKAKP